MHECRAPTRLEPRIGRVSESTDARLEHTRHDDGGATNRNMASMELRWNEPPRPERGAAQEGRVASASARLPPPKGWRLGGPARRGNPAGAAA